MGAGLESLRHEELRAALEDTVARVAAFEAAAADHDTEDLRAELEATRARVAALDEALAGAPATEAPRRPSWRARGPR